MKLAAIYNVWGDTEDLFPLSIESIRPHVDVVIVVWSAESSYGQSWNYKPWSADCVMVNHEPRAGMPAYFNETGKRQAGLEKAKELGCTHFLLMDGDEFYEPEHMHFAKSFIGSDMSLSGMVVKCKTYFARPWLCCPDTTLVTFITRLHSNTRCGHNPKMDYAYVDGEIRIDPTRQVNINNMIMLPGVEMHHYSWIRRSYKQKIENSTARNNIKTSTILRDLSEAKEGYYCEFYKQVLQRAKTDFGVPDLHNEIQNIQFISGASPAQ